MKRATPQMRHFARCLMVHEARGGQASPAGTPAAFAIPEQFRLRLASLMGAGGYRALLARALTLVAAEIPWLRAVQVQADGSLGGWEKLPHGPDELLEGSVVLLAQMFGLLVTFIGEELTLCLLRELWPKVPFNDLALENRDKR